MMTEVTRGEFDMLLRQLSDSQHRLDTIDQGGTRGVGIVQVQLTDLAKDVAEVKAWTSQHENDHQREERDRKSSRRWIIGTAIGFLAAIDGPMIYLISHLHH